MAVAEVTDATFESDVLRSERPVIVDFWAPWCVPCRRVSPILEEMSESREDVAFVKVNVDDNPELAMRYKVKLRVLSSFEEQSDEAGTLVCDEEDIMESNAVAGVAYSRDEAKLTLVSVADRPGIAAAICGNRQKSVQTETSGGFNAYAEPIEIVALQNDCGETGFVIDRGNTKKKKKRAN